MSWADDHFAGTYATKTTTIGAGVNIYYDKKFLRRATAQLRVAPLGQKRPLPKGEGKTIEFFRYNNIPWSVSSATLTEGVNPNATAVTGQKLQASIAEYGAFSQHPSLLKDTHIDRNLAGISELWGEHAANVIENVTKRAVCANAAYPIRGDGSVAADYYFAGVVDSSTATTLVDAALTSNTNYGDANDDLNQSVVVILTGTGAGQSRPVTDYVAASGTMTVDAWDINPAAGDTYVVVSAHGLTSSHKLTTANIRSAVQLLKNNRATPMADGYYVGVLSPDTEAGLMADSNWINVMQYKDGTGTDGLFAGEVGKWGGVRWVSDTAPFRFPITTVGTAGAAYGVGSAGGNYSATGAVYSNLILGQEAFGVTTFKDEGNFVRPGIITKTPGPNDTSNPLNRFSTVGWYMPFVAKGLNPLFAVQIWTGA